MHPDGLLKMAFCITDDCVGCGNCRRKCPWGAVLGKQKHKHMIEPTLCQKCGTCWYTCPKCAVEDPEGYRREKGRPRMPRARIDKGSCAGCQNCLLNCEQGAIQYTSSILVGYCTVDESLCVGCGSCLSYCASGCIELA